MMMSEVVYTASADQTLDATYVFGYFGNGSARNNIWIRQHTVFVVFFADFIAFIAFVRSAMHLFKIAFPSWFSQLRKFRMLLRVLFILHTIRRSDSWDSVQIEESQSPAPDVISKAIVGLFWMTWPLISWLFFISSTCRLALFWAHYILWF